jgi:glycosyltransferase involved in cell wall biosynthesis
MGRMVGGGVEAVVMNYYRGVDRSKIQFDFLVDGGSSLVPYEEIEALGGRVFTIPPYRKALAYHKSLARLFREQDWKIVHAHISTLSVFPLFAARRAKVPARIAHCHSTASPAELGRSLLKYALRPLAKVFPTHCFACSEHAGEWLFGEGGYHVVRNAVDLEKFRFDPQARESLRDELGVGGKFVIGHVGRFMKQKNHSYLLDIFAEVARRDENCALLLAGAGELEGRVREKARALGLADKVKFLGQRGDADKLYSAFDVLVLPSLYEGLALVRVEALATGCPCLVSAGCPHLVPTGRNEEELDLFGERFLPIGKADISKWAGAVLEKRERFADGMEKMRLAGFDIQTEALALTSKYQTLADNVM